MGQYSSSSFVTVREICYALHSLFIIVTCPTVDWLSKPEVPSSTLAAQSRKAHCLEWCTAWSKMMSIGDNLWSFENCAHAVLCRSTPCRVPSFPMGNHKFVTFCKKKSLHLNLNLRDDIYTDTFLTKIVIIFIMLYSSNMKFIKKTWVNCRQGAVCDVTIQALNDIVGYVRILH